MDTTNVADAQCEPWPLAPWCLPAGWDKDPAKWDDEQRAAQLEASITLRAFTAFTYGVCQLKVRPCRKPCAPWRVEWLNYAPMGVGSGPWIPILDGGQPVNVLRGCGCGGLYSGCGCRELCEITLNPYAASIVEVRVDGKVLPATAYRVDDYRKLTRTDGACWPECQQLELPDTAMGTFSVTYRTGVDPATDPGAMAAAAELAGEIYRYCRRMGGSCAPPSAHVTRIVRDGVEYDLDLNAYYSEGRTGLPRVDQFLARVNPTGARTTFQVWSPDIVHSRRTTWELRMCQEYTHTQTTEAAVWVINHNQACCPASVWIEDDSGAPLLGADVDCVAANPTQVTVTFGSPYKGKAVLKF